MTRRVLRPVTLDDADAMFAVYGDPETWRHLPEGLFTDRESVDQLVRRWVREWAEHGLSSWAVVVDGTVVGNCGVMPQDGWWNLGFRLSPRVWGNGVATWAARQAVQAAHEHTPAWPVVARSLATNPASARVSEKSGLTKVWSGPAVHAPDLVIHADRPLEAALLERLQALG